MNDTINKIIKIIHSEININLPNVNLSDLEENGKVYYINGQNGTLFDYYMNEKISDFMCFYKDGTCGIIKLRINKDGSSHIYLYNYGEKLPFIDKDILNQFTKDEVFNLAIILNKVMDEKGIFDKSINDYDFNIEINNKDMDEFLNYSNNNDTDIYGGFIISKNVLKGIPVGYTYREEDNKKELNGWTIYSINDNDEYVSNLDNFEIVSEDTIKKYCPKLLDIFNAPYGTDLCWQYKKKLFKNEFIGFYDLKNNKNVTIEEILNK